MDGLILETTFVVDLEREAVAGSPGAAHAFLEEHGDARLSIALITAGELACGSNRDGRDGWSRLVSRFRVLPPDREVCWVYGQTFRFLRDNGLLIGANDLWIGATALVTDLPLVTRNQDHFRRIPGLRVLGY